MKEKIEDFDIQNVNTSEIERHFHPQRTAKKMDLEIEKNISQINEAKSLDFLQHYFESASIFSIVRYPQWFMISRIFNCSITFTP